jgi:hypothetical protein
MSAPINAWLYVQQIRIMHVSYRLDVNRLKYNDELGRSSMYPESAFAARIRYILVSAKRRGRSKFRCARTRISRRKLPQFPPDPTSHI